MIPAIRNRMTATQRRAAIVETAIDLFSKHGFRGTTTRELAAAIGVSEPVLYQHFETKRALYEAIIESQSMGEADKVVPELQALSESGDNKAYFTRLAGLLLDWHLKDPRYCRLLMFSALEDHELSRLFYERRVAVFYELVTQHLDREIKKGVLREVDSLLTARSFVGMVIHHGIIFAVYCPGALQGSRDGIVNTVVGIFLNGISK